MREVVLQFGEQGIVVAATGNAPVVSAADLRIQVKPADAGSAFGFSWKKMLCEMLPW